MHNILLDYYFTLLEVLVILSLIGAVGIAGYWRIGRRWRNKLETLGQKHADDLKALEEKHADDLKALEEKHADDLETLEQKHADDLAKHDSEHFQTLHNHLKSAVAHEFADPLLDISKKSEATLERLGEEQTALREKQKGIIAKAYDLTQHTDNILVLFAPELDKLQMELLSIRQLIERVLVGFFTFAQSIGVVLMPNLEDVEPTALDRNLTLMTLKNVIHNAIKYSFPGGVVEMVLCLERGEDESGKTICVEVKDTGQGIREEDQEKIFELRTRGDGLIETGSGLGLYLARKAARRQGGDVVLVTSALNQGSVFRITLPYSDFEE